MSSATRVLFIAGAGRSGSTLVERTIGRLPGVLPLGEVMHMWQRGVQENQLCGCGTPFRECDFWTAVAQEAFGSWDSVDVEHLKALDERWNKARRIPTLLRARRNSEVQEYASHYARVYTAAAAVSGAEILIDSSKQVSLPFILAADPTIELSVLQVVRDPRGVAFSSRKKIVRPDSPTRTSMMPIQGARELSVTWDVHNAGLAPLRLLDVPTRRLRYEDFLAEPTRAIADIGSFLGASPDKELTDELRRSQVTVPMSHTASGNMMRFTVGTLDLRVDDAWQQELPARERRAVTALTFPLLVRYGYLKGAHR